MRPHFSIFVTCCVLYALVIDASFGLTPVNDHSKQQEEGNHNFPAQSRQRSNTRTGTQRRSTINASYYNRTSPSTPVCEYQTVMNKINDRVGILTTLDEDLRNRLEAINNKLTQFEESNLVRLESISAKQNDMQSKLDSLEYMQRIVRTTVDEIKGESEEVFRSIAARDTGIGSKQRRRRTANVSRLGRQVPTSAGATASAETREGLMKEIFTTNVGPTVDQKLDALAELLGSTAISLSHLRSELETNVTQLARSSKNNYRNFKKALRGSNSVALTSAAAHNEPVSNCQQAEATTYNGIAKLQLTPLSEPFYARCTDDGWLVILNRFSDDLNFERGWLDYKDGFGNIAGEFFIGLEKLHALTTATLHELRVVLEDHSGNVAQAGYSVFGIGSEDEQYVLNLLGTFDNGNAGDSLSYHAGSRFSTFDHDNDGCLECNCAAKHKGGGWFASCATTNLMGNYFVLNSDNVPKDEGLFWRTFPGSNNNFALKRVSLLIRPVDADADSV